MSGYAPHSLLRWTMQIQHLQFTKQPAVHITFSVASNNPKDRDSFSRSGTVSLAYCKRPSNAHISATRADSAVAIIFLSQLHSLWTVSWVVIHVSTYEFYTVNRTGISHWYILHTRTCLHYKWLSTLIDFEYFHSNTICALLAMIWHVLNDTTDI